MHKHTHTHIHTHTHALTHTSFFRMHKFYVYVTKIINMKENYKPLLTLSFPSWSKNLELFKEIFAIFTFVRFLDFFHSVKKVSKPSIFCEIMCVSKRTLVILIRMLYCTAFFKAKNFVILFFYSFVWFLRGEGVSLEVIFPGGNFLWGKFLGGNFHRGELS